MSTASIPTRKLEWDDQKAMAIAVAAGLLNHLTLELPHDPVREGRFIGNAGKLPDGRWAAVWRWYDYPEAARNGWAAVIMETEQEAKGAVLTAAAASQCEWVGLGDELPDFDG